MKYLKKSIREIDHLGNYPIIDTIESPIGPKVKIKGREYLLFSSNSYLGITTNQRVVKSSINAIKKYGTGSGSSRVVAGTFDIHTKLENEIALFKEKEAAMVLTSGYSTNVSLIPALANVFSIYGKKPEIETVIFSDRLNHASIIDGIKLSGCRVIVYNHRDIMSLEKALEENKGCRKLIITDSIFSMDGDIAPLDKIVELKKRYSALLMIDEAHATGVFGKHGKGIANFYNVSKDVDIIMGTLSKSFGSIGAYVAGDNDIIRLLKVSVRGYVFSTALTPPDISTSREVIAILNENPDYPKKILDLANYLRVGLNKIGFNTLGSETQIVPILIGDMIKSLKFQSELKKRRIIAPCIQWPAVERDKSRIRFSVILTHTKEDIDFLIKSCREVKNKLNI